MTLHSLTCAGFSHFFRKSSLALARNSFTANRNKVFVQTVSGTQVILNSGPCESNHRGPEKINTAQFPAISCGRIIDSPASGTDVL